MRRRRVVRRWAGVMLGGLLLACTEPALAQSEVERGRNLFRAGLCAACHTAKDGKYLAGGRGISSPYGTFYTPNITPDPDHGIGRWSDEDFVRALRQGVSPEGSHYYPAFPYTAYTKLKRDDVLAIKRYLDTVEPVDTANRAHDLWFFADWRWTLGVWKWLYFEPGVYQNDPEHNQTWNRGAYLVEAASHCAACHSPRNFLGALIDDALYSGVVNGPEGVTTPNITPGKGGIGSWNVKMLSFYLGAGMAPNGDFAGSLMANVIDKGTGHLSKKDRRAIATYILSLPARAGAQEQ